MCSVLWLVLLFVVVLTCCVVGAMKQMMQITKLRLLLGLLSGIIPKMCLQRNAVITCRAHFFANKFEKPNQHPRPIKFDEKLVDLVGLKDLATKSLTLDPYIHTRASINPIA